MQWVSFARLFPQSHEVAALHCIAIAHALLQRGIVTGAMLMALLDMGLRDACDAVYGASAGAINATYFLTSQPEGLDLYTGPLGSSRFISLKVCVSL